MQQQSGSPATATNPPRSAARVADALAPAEVALLAAFRALPPAEQAEWLATARKLASGTI